MKLEKEGGREGGREGEREGKKRDDLAQVMRKKEMRTWARVMTRFVVVLSLLCHCFVVVLSLFCCLLLFVVFFFPKSGFL